LDTVLGLSLTPTAVGWVLVEGHDAEGAVVGQADFEVRTGGATHAISTSERATADVLRARAVLAQQDRRLHLIGVTWSDEAAAEAALLFESLTDAGFDNLVPIRLGQASELAARGIAPAAGYDKTAVCVLDAESATVVMVDTRDGEAKTHTAAVKDPRAVDQLAQLLNKMFHKSRWQSCGVVVVGSGHDLDALSRQLEKALSVPVRTRSGVPLALAHGAALASARGTGFAESHVLDSIGGGRVARKRPYVRALTVLVGAAATFVASVSLAVGPRLLTRMAPGPVEHMVHRAMPSTVMEAPAWPPVAAPTRQPAPDSAPPEEPAAAVPSPEETPPVFAEPPNNDPAAEPAPPPEEESMDPPPPPEPNPHPLLTKLLERLHGQNNDPAPDDPPPAPPDAGGSAP
jgi:hypothetical protein